MAIQFSHQRLAETHHFAFAFPFRIEIAAAFTAAHRQRGEGIFKGLLKAEELKDGKVYRRMEAHTAFIGADSRVELHAPGAIYLHLVFVVQPHYAKLDYALWFNQTFQ